MIKWICQFTLALVLLLGVYTVAFGQTKTTEDVQLYVPPTRDTTGIIVKYGDQVAVNETIGVAVFPSVAFQRCGKWCVDSVVVRLGCSVNGWLGQYRHGTTGFDIEVVGVLRGYDADWFEIGDTVKFRLLSDGTSFVPEQQLLIDFTQYSRDACAGGSPDYQKVDFKIVSIDTNGTAVAVTDSLAISIKVEEFDRIHPNASLNPCTDTTFVMPVLVTGLNPVKLKWLRTTTTPLTSCAKDKYPWYEIQLLRLWNTDSTKLDDNDKLKAAVDWSSAQRFIVYGQADSVFVTIAEGTGYYTWRVRPIGNWYEGGLANVLNWGCWSKAPEDGYVFNLPSTNSTTNVSDWRGQNLPKQHSFFHYTQFDPDKNWQFSRVFMEGQNGKTGAAEGITYATTLLQPVQVQTPVASTGQVLVKQSVLDYYGRPVLQTLPATKLGVTDGKLSYDTTVALYGSTTKYRQQHFDETASLRSPGQMVGRIAEYWDNAADPNLPSAEGFPFVRSLYAPDPLSRPTEQGAAGAYLRVGKKSVTTDYAPVTDREMVTIFGCEAPLADKVFKTITRDQNGVTSLSYQRLDGKVVATCLVASDPVPNMLALNDSSYVNALTISDTLRYGQLVDKRKIVATRQLLIEDTTDVTFKYVLDVDVFSTDCPTPFCMSCDYDAIVSVRAANGDSIYADTITKMAAVCQGPPNDSSSVTLSLLPGKYTMTRTLVPRSSVNTLLGYQTLEIAKQKNRTDSIMRRVFTTGADTNDLVYLRRAHQDSVEDIAFRMFMRYKHFRDSLRQATDSLVIYEDSCCIVILDTSICKTGCETSEAERPQYEQMLINRWKDSLRFYKWAGKPLDSMGTAISTYIRDYDGLSLIGDLASPFPAGVGVIDSLFRKMIADNAYDCRKVYECWAAIVEGYWHVAWQKVDADSIRPRYGVNILDYVLDCLGSQYCEAAEFSEKVTGDAWMLNLWKKLPKSRIDSFFTKCATRYGYNSTSDLWTCDDTNQVSVNERYRLLRSCVAGSIAQHADSGAGRDAFDTANAQDPRNPFLKGLNGNYNKDSVELFLNNIQDSCLLLCEQRRVRFRDSLVTFYLRSGYVIEEYPDRVPTGTAPFDTLHSYELSCRVASLVTLCDEQCSFPIEWSGDTLIRPNEIELAELAKVSYSSTWEMRLPMEGDTCPSDEWTRIDNNVILADLVVEELNRRLALYKADSKLAGLSRWDIEPIIRQLAIHWPQISTCFPPLDTITNPLDTTGMETNPFSALTVMVDKSKNSFFKVVYVGATCSIVYVPPVTAEIDNPYSAANPHPLVDILNTYIRENWGEHVPDDALAAFTTSVYQTTAFFDEDDYYAKWTLEPLAIGVWADDQDPLEPDFSCDNDGIENINQGWELCPEPLVCVNSKDINMATLDDFLTVTSSSRIAFRMNPLDDSIRIYGWLMFNICGNTFRFRVEIPTSADSLLTLLWKDDETYSMKMQSDRSEWSKWFTGQNFLDSVGRFIQTDDGYLAFENYLDTSTTVFDCVKFSCQPEPTDSCNYIPICNLCDTVSCGPFCFRWLPADKVAPTTILPRVSCTVSEVYRLMTEIESTLMGTCLDTKLMNLEISYDSSCFIPARINDRFVATRGTEYYHYTLYYYDRAGNLVETVPPSGFRPLADTATRRAITNHQMITKYAYNTLGQLLRQSTPDGGESRFWYDSKGRLRLSHNARQASGTYSYTNYDPLGRIIEVGEKSGLATDAQGYIDANPTTSSGTYLTSTSYTSPETIPTPWGDRSQRNLRNRVSRTLTDEDGNLATTADQVLTYYSYDPHGNVEWLVQVLPATEEVLNPIAVCIEYDYDLISGKVTEVRMQPGRRDQFIQRYTYDHDQRVTSVTSSRDGVLWERDAAYGYYAHGPLKRMELGQDSIQGVDYAYTINGWLKGINMPSLSTTDDPGRDGYASGANSGYGRDAYGMLLGYHEKDFVKIGSVMDSSTSSWHVPNPTFLYNGNISSWATNTRNAAGTSIGALASVYHYDVLNRIRTDSMRTRGASAWDAVGAKWHSSYMYDGNGNMKTLNRREETGSRMDSLTYAYTANTNKLTQVDDVQGAALSTDLADQGADNYAYDATGNMTQDTSEGINTGGITWTPYNKIHSITQAGDDPTNKTTYLYDASGNRVLKRYYNNTSSTLNKTTWYVRDASGNVLGIYEKDAPSGTVKLAETPIYGSSRVGVARPDSLYSSSASHTTTFFDQIHDRTLRKKDYELTDHLGNVRVTASDVLIKHSSDYDADIATYTDYYPFGMQMPTREYRASDKHRYGYNGKENDNDVKTEGSQQDYGFRIYDPRVARFLSVDPLSPDYPMLTPYQFASNTPIWAIDLDGLEGVDYTKTKVLNHKGGQRFDSKKDVLNTAGLHLYVWEGNNVVVVRHTARDIVLDMNTAPGKIGMGLKYGSPWGAILKSSSKAIVDAVNDIDAKSNKFGMVEIEYQRGFLNTFRHQLWQSSMTMIVGVNASKDMADYHELDGYNTEGLTKDGVVDIVNNVYGREYGAQFDGKAVFSSISAYTDFVNGLVQHLAQTVTGYDTDKRFDPVRSGSAKLFDVESDFIKDTYNAMKNVQNATEAKESRGKP